MSPRFLAKEWALRELDGLLARESTGRKVILPVWHQLSREALLAQAPILADRVAVTTSIGLEAVAQEILRAVGRQDSTESSGESDDAPNMPPPFPPFIHEDFQERRRGRIVERVFTWDKDRAVLYAAIPRHDAEQAANVSELASQRLRQLEYPSDVIDSFRVVFVELSRNAFDHACSAAEDAVRFAVDLDIGCVSLVVFNPPGVTLDIGRRIRRQSAALSRNEMKQRGRGLLLVAEAADVLQSTPDGAGVKVVLYKTPVSLELASESGVTIVRVGGIENPSFNRRLLRIAREHLDTNLLLDFTDVPEKIGTSPITVIIQVAALLKRYDRKVAAVMSGRTGAWLPGALRVRSRREGIELLALTSDADRG